MQVALTLSTLVLLAVSFPFIRGARHTLLISGVIVLVFCSGFGIKGSIRSTPVLLVNSFVNLAVVVVLWRRLDNN